MDRYCLEKFRKIKYTKKDTSYMDFLCAYLNGEVPFNSFNFKRWMFANNVIEEINKQHPNSYWKNIRKNIK